MWRYTSLNDIINILIVTVVSSAAIISLLLLGNRFAGPSREPDSEIEIRYVGLRAGEKLYEEPITES